MMQANVKRVQVRQTIASGVAIPKELNKRIHIGDAAERATSVTVDLRLTAFEVKTIVMAFFFCAILLVGRMYIHGQQLELQQAAREYTQQTHNLHAQTAVMENEIQMKRNYETVQQAAQDAGMTINRANVKVVGNGAE